MAELSGTSNEVRVFDGVSELMRATAEEIALAAHQAVSDHGRFTWALAGGSTPRTVYELLASDFYRARMPWSAIHFFWGDERHVPPDHADSNYRMARETLLDPMAIPAENVHRILAENQDAAAAATQYEAELRRFFSPPAGAPEALPRFDLVLLGLGPEGHTLSLFPGSPALHESERWVVAPWVEKLQTFRITLTPPVLNRAAAVLFLAAGEEKADALHAVLEEVGDADLYPARIVRPDEGDLLRARRRWRRIPQRSTDNRSPGKNQNVASRTSLSSLPTESSLSGLLGGLLGRLFRRLLRGHLLRGRRLLGSGLLGGGHGLGLLGGGLLRRSLLGGGLLGRRFLGGGLLGRGFLRRFAHRGVTHFEVSF
ncbi:MAG: 6-phosphogluconolactonase [Acidobacteria bacterium]|nr:MAG: 6-phosphogluconolactonase [Acidobacteriota bacterium]